jgi:myo-inositol-1(or 4)-monophosphatase
MSAVESLARVGRDAAFEAGEYLLSRFHRGVTIEHKGEIDLVTDVDLAAEELIVDRLRSAFPDHAILAEEKHKEQPEGSHTWIIDPLDGTTNFAQGFPFFAVSIALEVDGRLVWGMVFNPVLQEDFSATLGGGALLNGTPIGVSKTKELNKSFLATGFPYDIRTSPENNLDHFRAFALKALAIRRAGSAALDLCYVAAGRFDGFWELKLNPWDCAAGYLMVREAGGRVTDFRGRSGSIYDRQCVASNTLIHDQMLEVIQRSPSLTNSLRGR